ncbi:hypothetical protein BDZ89DRAFT_418535 [Hymenopellis radicata]|nr:hypothetical protein BDZ89DRAFT_418535 [Hymenopellis radicata]
MISSTDNPTVDLKRRRTLQGRYGRHVEQSWVGRRATKMISTLEEEVRDQEHVAKERQITLDILEGRRPADAHKPVLLYPPRLSSRRRSEMKNTSPGNVS